MSSPPGVIVSTTTGAGSTSELTDGSEVVV